MVIGVPSGYSTPAMTISASKGGKKLNRNMPLNTIPNVIIKMPTATATVLARLFKTHLKTGW